jgi:hypothetical protein
MVVLDVVRKGKSETIRSSNFKRFPDGRGAETHRRDLEGKAWFEREPVTDDLRKQIFSFSGKTRSVVVT